MWRRRKCPRMKMRLTSTTFKSQEWRSEDVAWKPLKDRFLKMSVLASERHWPGIKHLRFTSSAAHQENRQLHVRCVSNCVNYPLMSAPLMSPCPISRINALFRFGGVLKFCKQNLLLLSYICLLMVLRTSKTGCFLFLSFPTLQQKSFWQEFLTLDSFSNTTYIIHVCIFAANMDIFIPISSK